MLGNTRVERIGLDILLPTKQSKILSAHDQMQVARHPANAAIAFRRLDISRDINFESNPATVATTFMCRHGYRQKPVFPILRADYSPAWRSALCGTNRR